ncbi:MAG: peptidoglycan-binding domain-containing protein [bacterium]|nr:peptidoglycan-binding domain-containing protein [bacterium]
MKKNISHIVVFLVLAVLMVGSVASAEYCSVCQRRHLNEYADGYNPETNRNAVQFAIERLYMLGYLKYGSVNYRFNQEMRDAISKYQARYLTRRDPNGKLDICTLDMMLSLHNNENYCIMCGSIHTKKYPLRKYFEVARLYGSSSPVSNGGLNCYSLTKYLNTDRTASTVKASYIQNCVPYLKRLGYQFDENSKASILEAVRRFQHENNFQWDVDQFGGIDSCTMDRIERRAQFVQSNQSGKSSFNGDYTLLKEGDRNERVRILNKMLSDLKFGAPSGNAYTDRTTKAVKAFQSKYLDRYPQDGLAGPLTLSKLEAVWKSKGFR